jgi:hypothetical protein
MSALPRRYRSSTSASNPTTSKSLEILTLQLDDIAKEASSRGEHGYPDSSKIVKGLRGVAQHVSAPATAAHQDDFRHAQGFERILDVLRAFSGYYNPEKRTKSEILALLKLLGESLNVLSAALRNHAGNKRFF